MNNNTEYKYGYVLSDLAKIGAGIGNHSNKYAKIIRLTILLFGRYIAYNHDAFSGKDAADNYKTLISALGACMTTLTTPIDGYEQCVKNLGTFKLFMQQHSELFDISKLIENDKNAEIKEIACSCIRFEKPWTKEINYISSLRVFLIAVSKQKQNQQDFYYPVFGTIDCQIQNFVHYHMLPPGEPGPGGLPETTGTYDALVKSLDELKQKVNKVIDLLSKSPNSREPHLRSITWQKAAVSEHKAEYKDKNDNEEDIIIRTGLVRFLYEMKEIGDGEDPHSYGASDEDIAPHLFKYKKGKLEGFSARQVKTAYGHIGQIKK